MSDCIRGLNSMVDLSELKRKKREHLTAENYEQGFSKGKPTIEKMYH